MIDESYVIISVGFDLIVIFVYIKLFKLWNGFR